MTTPRRADISADAPYCGRLHGGVHRFAIRTYYEDTDAGGVVYHAGYLRFMERARSDLLALCGIDPAMTGASDHFVVAEASLRYLRPARLGEALLIESCIAEVRGAVCVVQQNVSRDGLRLVEGRLVVVLAGGTGRPRRIPSAWVAALAAVNGGLRDG